MINLPPSGVKYRILDWGDYFTVQWRGWFLWNETYTKKEKNDPHGMNMKVARFSNIADAKSAVEKLRNKKKKIEPKIVKEYYD